MIKFFNFSKSIVAFVMLGCLASCSQAPVQQPTSFETMVLKNVNRDSESTFTSKIEGLHDVNILPMISGNITEIKVTEGNYVKKGQTLFVIDRRTYESQLQAANANYEMAKAQMQDALVKMNSQKALFEKGIIGRPAFEQAESYYNSMKSAVSVAKAQVGTAQTQLSFCTITSPHDGFVGRIPYRIGDLVSPSMATPLTIVSDISSVQALFSITESAFAAIQMKLAETGAVRSFDSLPDMQLRLKDGSLYNCKGRITSISGVVDPVTGSIACRATFPNPDKVLRSGMSATLVFPLNYQNIMVIPQSATVQLQDKRMAYRVKEDNTAEAVIVDVTELGDGKEFVVNSGLNEGDEIVTIGVNNIVNGQQVKFPAQATKQE